MNPTDFSPITKTYGEHPEDPSKLLPELRPYYEPGRKGWFPMLRSPFVYQVPFFSWKLANESYKFKRAKATQYMLEGKLEPALWIYERPYRLDIIHEWMAQGLDVKPFFLDAWIDTELPDVTLAKPMYREMFLALGFLTDVEGLKYEDLPSHVTLYRGALARWKRGLAWTRNPKVAKFFADRIDGAEVWETTVPKSAILAWVDGRGEQEVVVHPKKIREVKQWNLTRSNTA